MKIVRKKKAKIFNLYLLTHLGLFLIPFLGFGSFFYFSSINSTKTNTESVSIRDIEVIKSDFDEKIISLYNTALNIAADPDFTPNGLRRDNAECISKLKLYRSRNIYLTDDIAFFYRNTDTAYTSKGICTMRNMLASFNIDIPMEELDAYFDKHTTPFILNTTGAENSEKCIYAVPLTKYNRGVLLFSLNTNTLTESCQYLNYGFNEMEFLQVVILDSKNKAVTNKYKNFDLSDSILTAIKSNEDKNMFKAKSKIGKLVIFNTNSKDTGYRYVLSYRAAEYYRNIRKLQIFTLIFLLIGLVFGLYIALCMVRINYKPMRELISHASDSDDAQLPENEFEYVKNALINLQNNNNELSQRLGEHEELYREQSIIAVINGRYDEETINNLQQHFVYENFMAAVMPVERNIYKELENILYTLSLPDTIIQTIEGHLSSKIIIVVNYSSEAAKNEFKKYIKTVYDSAKDNMPPIGIGKSYKQLSDIGLSYNEACTALEYHNMQHPYVLFENIETNKSKENWIEIDKSKLTQSVKNGQTQIALSILDSILDIFKHTNTSFLYVRLMISDIINSIIKTANELNISIQQNKLYPLMSLERIEPMEKILSEVLKDLCDEVQALKKRENTNLATEITEFISEHYTENDFCMNTVCEKFNISRIAVGNIIKNHTGSTFIDYVTNLRIERVKYLLTNTDDTVKSIVGQVGYYDVANFIRKFKNIEKMTPNQYRNINKNK